jgi:two-component system chemotaxis response regulator CheB
MSEPNPVVVVDDSPFVCRLLTSYLQSAADLRVVGTAFQGHRALEIIRELRPAVVTLDLEMPEMDGLAVLDRIMHEVPTPVVVVSGVSRRAAVMTLQALETGAVDFVLRYSPGVDTDVTALRREIIAKVRLAATIRVIRSLQPRTDRSCPPAALRSLDRRAENVILGRLVVIGASTGGPEALRVLLGQLPGSFAGAVIVVQHLPASFTAVLATQLRRHTLLPVKEAAHGDLLVPGSVVVAPGGRHLLVRGNGRLEVFDGPKVGGHRPSIDVTMQAAAQTFGARVQGVVLTGIGNDGTLGLAAIRRRGGETFAQDAASCVVSSMPAQAVAQGAVDHVAAPAVIARLLCREEKGHEQSEPRSVVNDRPL